ncbi:MAG TPA: sigma-54 dependent transcriptional regulator [Candidatus Acidoferrales bacterium]|jgi:formate hydrogenlyase transcriptional activator|nr:sigma-54 dependent transcriptional regulator [Candidatus Acidoferrales bacterium]
MAQSALAEGHNAFVSAATGGDRAAFKFLAPINVSDSSEDTGLTFEIATSSRPAALDIAKRRSAYAQANEDPWEGVIGSSPALRKVMQQVDTVAPTSSTVLIAGETGTGKELIARAIHRQSRRRPSAFSKINCAAIPRDLIESELFGHERGAFTGAVSQRQGRFELAHEGTLFLDEVGDMPLEVQPKLLRVLQEQEFERVGGSRTLHVNVRIVAATNRDLEEMVQDKTFRSDLFYRLNVFPIVMPALRERGSDIPELLHFFASLYSQRMKRPFTRVAPKTIEDCMSYDWPGNVRELQNLVERAVILSDGPVLRVALPESIPSPQSAAVYSAAGSCDLSAAVERLERELISRTLRECRGVVGGSKGAAARLGVKRTSLLGKMQKLGLDRRPSASSPSYEPSELAYSA